jgi:hypothetical protein
MPTMSRPFERTSIVESCFANRTGWRWGSTITPTASRTRLVNAAR